ncbi:hypothetical protein MUY27_10425 [Mucilaginibacter sp. RS28]|uniref:Uncharacterized protein n=1 Tax=Mucilaginibacter straminoryzae TaxID=2932774 RepID=A0A9X1X4B8_9SPHI|nr:hypothetical protein [Mucilaginibacter straminoryzae]MCJ8210125.1 hypothetical protein [Mucilaginibacter straminoryzae]
MYWYKNTGRGFALCLLILFGLTNCRPELKERKGDFKFFDLKGFVRTDSARLASQNPTVAKTVSHNGEAETKAVKIANWGQELSLFSGSDINKPSWRQSYKASQNGNTITYTALVSNLKTRQIIIQKSGDNVKSLQIYNHTKNLLYETSEKLFYYPDSLYRIDKTQHVLFLGENRYIITGKF